MLIRGELKKYDACFALLPRRGNRVVTSAALKYYHEIPIRFSDLNLDEVLEIASRHKIYAYDAYFIAVSKELNAPLFSLDHNLLKIASKEGLKIIEV